MKIIIRVSGYRLLLTTLKPTKPTAKSTSRVSPAVEVLYFCFAKVPKEKGDPQRVEFPPQPCRSGRGRNLRRATVAPLRTADRLRP
jgi:hypothetical protein